MSGSDSNPLAIAAAGVLFAGLILALWEQFEMGERLRRWLGGR